MVKPISFRARTALTLVAAAILVAVSVATASARVAPVNTVSPTISGKPRVGQTLSATQGEWQGSPTSFFYQWFRCDQNGASCAAIDAATQPTYALARRRRRQPDPGRGGCGERRRRLACRAERRHQHDSDPGPDLDRETAGQRRRPGGPDAERDDRNLDRLARFLRVPVEAVPGRPVHRDPRRDGLHLRALRGGGRHQGPRPGYRLQRRRQGLGAVALDRDGAVLDRRIQARPAEARPQARPGALPGHGPVGRSADPPAHGQGAAPSSVGRSAREP